MSRPHPTQAASVAIFCPQSKAPDQAYLDQLRDFYTRHAQLRKLADDLQRLSETWDVLAARKQDIAALHQGPQYLRALDRWVETGESGPVANAMSGILSLPLLVVIQTCQYFQYLQLTGLSHAEFLRGLEVGGAQGYCGGLLPAIAVACAKDEEEVVRMAGIAMRIALAVGAYGELGDDENLPGPTTIVLRLRYEGQGDDIARRFPGSYVSAITDPKTISIVGSVPTLEKVIAYARELGLQAQGMHLRGKVHNPENAELAQELCELCDGLDSLTLPSCEALQVPVYSNITGRQLQDCSLTHEAVLTILASRCEWWTLLNELASALKSTGEQSHTFAMFGIGDCVPLMPFHQAKLKISKIDIHRTIREAELRDYTFPEDAIAIVGAACRLPGANNLEELWELIAGGVSKAEEIRPDRIPLSASFRASQDEKFTSRRKFFGNFVEEVDGFDHTFFRTNPKEAAYMDPQQRILLELAYEAMDSSGYLRSHKREDGDNIGCFIGASFNEYLDNTSAHAPTAYTSTGTIRAFLCGKISYYFGWSGPAEVIDTACSASLVAINRGCRAIMSGECTQALAGGVNIMSGINNYMDLGKAGFLSPTGQCKPFDQDADGYCRADGAGLVVLKSLRHARADGDNILGVIPGVATNQGGLSASITVPHSPAQMTLYRRILKQAGMKAEQVSYVECHGTGTQAGDPLEMASVREVFCSSDRRGTLHVGSLKGNIGHCETAAGVASLLKVLAMLQKQRIPPLASFRTLNRKIPALASDKIAVAKQVEAWDAPLRAACVNSYGAAGSNSALLCVEMKQPTRNRPTSAAWPIVVSAASRDSLAHYCHDLDAYLCKNGSVALGDLSFTLAERRQRHRVQLVTTAADVDSLRAALTNGQREASTVEVEAAAKAAATAAARSVVLAFGGQSKQTVALDRELYASSPRLRTYLATCDALLVEMGCASILPAVFAVEPIADIVVLQTATFAVQYACAQCWEDAGVRVAAVVGHSFGELTALAFSGAISLRSGLKLVAARAQLMATRWGPERGTMLAVHAARDVVEQLAGRVGELEVACYNAETSQVVVGSAVAIERAEAMLASDKQFAGVRSQRVDVSHGFHSRFTDPLLGELADVAASLAFSKPRVALEMCVPDKATTQPLGPWRVAEHTRAPVYFVDAVRRIERRLGTSCLWLEAGTDAPIIAMAKRAVAQPANHVFVPVRRLADATTALWREGLDVTFWPCLGGPAESGLRHVYLPPYHFVRASAWVANIDRAREAEAAARAAADAHVERDVKSTLQPAKLPSLLVTQQLPGSPTFTVNVASSRFRDIVSGHAVRGRPLCPASMYMECAVMALQCHLGPRFDKACALSFDNLTFEHPLGIDSSCHVSIVLSETAESGRWAFQLRSSASSANSRVSTHGRGNVRLGNPVQLHTFKHLIAECVEQVTSKHGTETLLSKRAYGLFSQVVTYAPLMRGIQSITMDGTRAVASIKVPSPHVALDESSAIALCDTVSIDTFIQVVGLLINSSDACIPGHVFVATGVESATLSQACDFTAADTWTVYAVFRSTSDTTATGDVFVMTPGGAMALTVMDVKFTRLSIATLEKLLDTANSGPTAKKETSSNRSAPTVPSRHALPDLEAYSSADSEQEIDTPPNEHDDSSLRKMISMYTGVSLDSIATQASMADLGVDSLAAVEFAEDIRSQFGKDIESMDLLQSDLAALSQLCLAATPKPLLKKKLVKATVVQTDRAVPAPEPIIDRGRDRLVQIVSDACGAPALDIKDSHTLRDLGVDSLASVELSSDLENAFSIHIDDNDLHLDSTIADIIDHLGIKSSTPSPSPAQTIEPYSRVKPAAAASAVAAVAPQGESNTTRQRVLKIISDACGAPVEAMGDDQLLRDLGVDSLAAMELKSDLEDAFDVELDESLLELSISEVVEACGGTLVEHVSVPTMTSMAPDNLSPPPRTTGGKSSPLPADMASLFESLVINEGDCTAKARICGFQDFGATVAPRQDELMLAYIIEAFSELGVDLVALEAGALLPPLVYRRKHAYGRLMQRIWVILGKHDIVKTISTSHRVRGSAKCPQSTSATLLSKMRHDFPAYQCEFSLLSMTGSQLGQCLAGKQDPIALMFKTQEAQAIMEDFYLTSPMLATATEMLVDTVVDAVSRSNVNNPINILEIGAGFGGTTRKLVKRLDILSRSINYTFTDISPTLVSRALKSFAGQYPWLQFQTWNMELAPPSALSATGLFDIIIGTNCVHATKDRTATLGRLKNLLHPTGYVILSEVTEIVDWYDITYGLLDSWWADKDGHYPLQSVESWMACFKNAGFPVASYSQGSSADLNTQRLLIASMRKDVEAPKRAPPRPALETFVYHTVDGVDIHADVSFPKSPPVNAMPIALMIHGGGHMTLSRKAVRPYQTSFLLDNGILPVSIDYRLCPEVNLIDGPIADTLDAYKWITNVLPELSRERGIVVDAERVVVIGWSSGGQLAMTTAWTTKSAGMKPPLAILSFYGPTDFESGDLDKRRAEEYPERTMKMKEIIKALPKRPITQYDGNGTDTTGLGWVRPGDPRSELVLSLFKEGGGLSLLLNGLPRLDDEEESSDEEISDDSDDNSSDDISDADRYFRAPDAERIAFISPLAQLRRGNYMVPTFVIHGTRDEIVPYHTAVDFVDALRAARVEAHLLSVQGARHIHDVSLNVGSKLWDETVAPGYEFLLRHLRC
ncbi:hypothetical protein C7974DRAFT_449039 [Boeremia exigua]|uniref:uncharacterized protein n=1 Tax=Boeremia exigua TaxID=749465 RepID=UPI001E8E1830|nr:uncharacterized protein C7974DRAFT_449039 [Boeremia exigua]KAH6639121.1 hypothetical protein C7974DRAFT_449039 [Boeremia exigua]